VAKGQLKHCQILLIL